MLLTADIFLIIWRGWDITVGVRYRFLQNFIDYYNFLLVAHVLDEALVALVVARQKYWSKVNKRTEGGTAK